MKLKSFGLQRVAYAQAEAQQQMYARMMLDAKKSKSEMPPPALFAFEMDPVYTCGRRQIGGLDSGLQDHFRDNGKAEFIETQRGGHVTFHGPGQLVMYPIFDLHSMQLKTRDYVCKLEQGIIDLLHDYDLDGRRTESTGVWLSDSEKICSIGVHVRRSVTSHGIGLNIATDPYWFNRIVACNLPNAKMVSLNDYRQANLAQVSTQLEQHYKRIFNLE